MKVDFCGHHCPDHLNAAIIENPAALSEYRETVKQLIAENRTMPDTGCITISVTAAFL